MTGEDGESSPPHPDERQTNKDKMYCDSTRDGGTYHGASRIQHAYEVSDSSG